MTLPLQCTIITILIIVDQLGANYNKDGKVYEAILVNYITRCVRWMLPLVYHLPSFFTIRMVDGKPITFSGPLNTGTDMTVVLLSYLSRHATEW